MTHGPDMPLYPPAKLSDDDIRELKEHVDRAHARFNERHAQVVEALAENGVGRRAFLNAIEWQMTTHGMSYDEAAMGAARQYPHAYERYRRG